MQDCSSLVHAHWEERQVERRDAISSEPNDLLFAGDDLIDRRKCRLGFFIFSVSILGA